MGKALMKKTCAVCGFLFLISAHVIAQESNKPRPGYFLFAAPGAQSDSGTFTAQVGVGAEGYLYRGFGLGFDAGGIWDTFEWNFMMSLNTLYNFNTRDKSKLSPFLIGGVTGISSGERGLDGGINFGGGIQYWFVDRIGLRAEFRDHIITSGRNQHYPQCRIAIVFRMGKARY